MAFRRPEIIRPPSEWDSYFLPLTAGCSNNTCVFCNYHGCKLQLRELPEVKAEIDALDLYMKHGIRTSSMPYIVYAVAREWNGRKVFLQDGDALVYPFPKLKEALDHLNIRFPGVERIASYATPQDVLRRSPSELRELKDLRLGILYMGVESGDEEVLARAGKGAGYAEVVEAGKRVKEAGILLSVTVILGLGGVERSREHAQATARILTDLDPDFGGALTLTIVPGTPLRRQAQQGEFRPISPLRSLEELRTIVENARFSNCFFSSMHASNYLSIRGALPGDRDRMLGDLERVLSCKDPSLLRPEYLRGL